MALTAALGTRAASRSSKPAKATSTAFSPAQPKGALPKGWQRIPFDNSKASTQRTLAQDDGNPVLNATARSSVSLMLRIAQCDPGAQTIVKWRWRIDAPPEGASNSVSSKEDSATRLVFVFYGNKSSLPRRDRAVMRMAKTLSGRELPDATLMYVISGVADVGKVIENPHTRRVQMVVASSASQSVGRWVEMQRDLSADFRKAFGEAPGRLIAYGVMSDTDNTGSKATAWYEDIEVLRVSQNTAGGQR